MARTKEQTEQYFANFKKQREEKERRKQERALEREKIREEKQKAREAEILPNVWWTLTIKVRKYEHKNPRKINKRFDIEREAAHEYNQWLSWAAKKNVFCEIEAYKVTPDGEFKWEPTE